MIVQYGLLRTTFYTTSYCEYSPQFKDQQKINEQRIDD